ncbi:MAG TPA: AAA family ATPase, partial [Kurthia sp.]
MQFQKLQIYGFGRHRDEVIDFSSGMNILFGNNEAGKTTIYECILQILFGFPQKNHLLRSYEPKGGGSYGGMLSIVDDEYGAYTVERVGGKAGGNVRVQLENGESGEEELLKKLLRGHGRSDLEAIFAFSMHQLQALEKMNEDELNRTLLASGTTGVDQLTQIEKQLIKESNSLFKKSGQNPSINKLIKNIQNEESLLKIEREKLSKYEQKKAELFNLEQDLH